MLTPRIALLAGAAFFASPALAQETPQQQVNPPPIMVTPAPAPAAPAPEPSPQIVIQPSAPVVQSVPSVAEQQRGVAAADAPAPAPRRAPAATSTRTTRTTVTRAAPAPAPQPAAQVPAGTPAAPAPAPEAAPAAPPPQAQTGPAPEVAPATEQTATTQSTTSIAWPWLLGGVALVIAGLALFLLSRRRRNEEVVTSEPATIEPVRSEPTAAPEPVMVPEPAEPTPFIAAPPVVEEARIDPAAVPPAVAPIATEDAELAEARKDDLAGVADIAAPVSQRPWLELGLRPVSAGTSEEEAMVDFELTVGNSGDTEARNVRISSFMLADETESSDMERMLVEHRGDTLVPPVSIEPGDGTRVDAHLAVPKGELGRTFNPVVVAEARYTLPDGSEGRTAAAFRIGRPAYEGGIGAIGSSRPHMVEDLAAELYGQPEHA